MKNKLSILFLLIFLPLCTTIDENLTSDNIKIGNFNLVSLTSEESIKVDDSFIIINYWASWCLECIEEHDLLITLAETNNLKGSVIMVSFQDNIQNSIEFLNNYGYGEIIYAVDESSKLAIESGVFGVPETHIVVNGEIVKKYIGPLNLSNIEEIINNYP
jgi:cytochrome c biogenesis protein CcmG/thiol:disulfide interchange protein DsbE